MAGLTTTVDFSNGDQVTSPKLDEIIGGASFTTDAVTGTTLSVVGGQLKVGTITLSEMGAASVGETQLVTLSVTTNKIAFGAVGTLQLGNLSVTTEKLAAQSVTYTQLSPSVVATVAQVQNQTASKLVTADNVAQSPASAKCYGEFSISGTGRTIKTNSFNVASLTRVSATQTGVVIDNNMSGDNYTVIAGFESDGVETGEVAIYDKVAGSFKIKHPAEAAGRTINFIVFGKYA